MFRTKAFRDPLFKTVITFGVVVALAAALVPGSAHAYTNSRMIDDQIFNNTHSMDATAIQNFLNTFPNSCIKSYQSITPVDYYTYGNNTSVANIFSWSATHWGINPQVLIATMQKEEQLIDGSQGCDSWRYVSAMGYDCPGSLLSYPPGNYPTGNSNNTSPSYPSGIASTCVQHATAIGLSAQVDHAGWNLEFGLQRAYGNTSWDGDDATTYYGPMTQGSRARCGTCTTYYYDGNNTINGQSTFIANGATASLYNYTPFLNQSFPGIFENWFGSTTNVASVITMNTITQPDPTPAKGETVSYSFSLTNNSSSNITLDAVGTVGRAGSLSGPNRDFGWQGPVTLTPGVTQQFTFSTVVRDSGAIYAWPAFSYQGIYTQYNNWGTTLVSHQPNLSLSQPLTINPTTIYAGQNVTFSAVLKNNEAHAINYDAIGIPVRFYGSYSYDATWVGPGTIGSGAEITLTGARNIDKPGPFTYWVSSYIGGTYTTIGAVQAFNSLVPAPNFSVSGLSFTNNPPAVGQSLGASFTVTNNLPVPIDVDAVGIVGRLGTFAGPNRDIGWQGPVHFNAGETKSFTGFSRTVTDVGTAYYWIGILYKGNYMQYNNWGSTIVSH